MQFKSIAVVVITYNQEKIIERTLDSLFNQREWGLSQVIVGDDCSTDNTWEILQRYKRAYPEIMCPIRNNVNMGIYPNLIKTLQLKAPSDLYFCMAGDDSICEGYFKNLQNFINLNKVNTNEAVGIYSDWKEVNQDGHERIFKQDIVTSGISLVSLLMRLKIYNRSIVVSQKVVDSYDPIIFDKGLKLAEMMFEILSARFIEKVYYMPQVTTTYHKGIGISTQLSIGKSDYYTRQAIIQWQYFKDHYAKTYRDKCYCNYQRIKASYRTAPTWKKYILIFFYYLCSILPHGRDSFKTICGNLFRLLKYKISYQYTK